MLCQKRRNLLVHDRDLNRLCEHRELRQKRLAVFEDTEDGLGAPIKGSQKKCQASADDGVNRRGRKQSRVSGGGGGRRGEGGEIDCHFWLLPLPLELQP